MRDLAKQNTSSGNSSHSASNSLPRCASRACRSRHQCRTEAGKARAQRSSAGVHGTVPNNSVGT